MNKKKENTRTRNLRPPRILTFRSFFVYFVVSPLVFTFRNAECK